MYISDHFILKYIYIYILTRFTGMFFLLSVHLGVNIDTKFK